MEKNKMIRLVVVIVLCIAVVIAFYMWFSWADRESEKTKTGGSNVNYIIEGLSTYEDAANGVSFKYPADWDQQDLQPGVVGFAHKSGTNITFAVEDLSAEPVTLEEYTESALAGLDNLDFTIEVFTSGESTIGLEDYPSYTITYTTERPADAAEAGFQTKAKASWTVQNNKAFVMTYTAPVENYEAYLPMGDQSMESISIQ